MGPIAEILALLALGELTDEQNAHLSELYLSLTDEQLAGLETAALARFDEIRAGEEITAEGVTELGRLADAVDGVRSVSGERYAAAETAAAEAAAEEEARQQALADLDARIRPAVEDPPADPPVVDPPTAVDPPVEPAVTPEPVAAAATGVASRAAIQARAPQSVVVRNEPPRALIASAGGGTFADFVEVEDALLQRWADTEGTDARGKLRVATIQANIPDDRRLRAGRITDVTEQQNEMLAKIREPGGAESLTADGGICAPVEFYYGVQTLGHTGRSLRASIGAYGVDRGGLAFNRPMTVTDILAAETPTSGNAIGVVTEAQDAASTYNKSFQTVTCPTSVEVRVDAIYQQLKFGVFFDRTNPERKAQFTELTAVRFARFTEQRLWAKMLALTVEMNAPQALGATRDFITAMNRWGIGYRGRHRMPEKAQLDVWVPSWVLMGLMPDDQVRALQSYPEQFDVTAAWVISKLRDRGINVAGQYEDDFTTAVVAGGGIPAYPTTFRVIGGHPGIFVMPDAGRLDLGAFRDSALVADNTFMTFAEEFWNLGMWGVEANNIEFSLCANGASAGSIAPHCGS